MIVVVAGVSGSGKTTVGGLLATRLGWPFTDGDQLHPASNVAKMASGLPLTDDDRLPWLRAIAAEMDSRIDVGQSAVLACSALKRAYRDLLVGGRVTVGIAFLIIDRDVAARRLAARHGHFFDPKLLDSQFADLEPPTADEAAVVVVPAADRPQVTADLLASRLGLAGALDPPGTSASSTSPGR